MSRPNMYTEVRLPRFGSREFMMVAQSNHFIRGNYLGDQHLHSDINSGGGVHALDWYHSLPMSYVEAPTASPNVRRRYNDRTGRRRYHRFLHRPHRHIEDPTASPNVRRSYNDRAGRRRCHRFLHRSYHHVQAPTASANVRRRYNDRAGRRRCHRFQHRPYGRAQPVQEIRCHPNFYPLVTASLYRDPTYPSSSSAVPTQNAPFAGNMHNLPISYVQAPSLGGNVSTLEENTRIGLRRRHHHSNFHSHVNRVPTSTNHSNSSMPVQNAPRRDNMHNHHPPALREFPSYMLMDTDVQEFPSYMLMDTDDMSYETFSNVQESSSLGDSHNDVHLDIGDMSYELFELAEWINDNSEFSIT